MSRRELERVEVTGRVASGNLQLNARGGDAGVELSAIKRVWRRYRQRGAAGLAHGNAGRESNRGKPKKLRRRRRGGQPLSPVRTKMTQSVKWRRAEAAQCLRRW